MNLQELQKKVEELEKIRHFDHEDEEEKMDFLRGEVYELDDAIKGYGNVAEECIDVINTTVMIANRYGIDLEKAFLEKYEKDKLRV